MIVYVTLSHEETGDEMYFGIYAGTTENEVFEDEDLVEAGGISRFRLIFDQFSSDETMDAETGVRIALRLARLGDDEFEGCATFFNSAEDALPYIDKIRAYRSYGDYADEYLESHEIPEYLLPYIDLEKLGRDYLSDVKHVQLKGGIVVVFD